MEFSDEAVLTQDCSIVDDSLGCLVVMDRKGIYVFDDSGHLQQVLNRQGDGPESYLNALDAFVDWGKDRVYISDYLAHKHNAYRLSDGKYLYAWRNDTVSTFALSGNGCWLAYNERIDSLAFDLCLFDAGWNLLWGRAAKVADNAAGDGAYRMLSTSYKSDGKLYVYERDTLFSVGSEGGLSPFVAVNKGSLSIPPEVMYDFKRKQERNKYIYMGRTAMLLVLPLFYPLLL